MKSKGIKFKITLLAMLCSALCMVPFAYALEDEEEEYEPPELNIKIPEEYHVDNTPQWDDELVAEVKPKTVKDEDIVWYRFYNAKYDEKGNVIKESYYVAIATGRTYKVTAEDKGHCLKCEVAEYNLVKETEPVAKKNYGLPDNLKVKNNTYFGDTDGSVYFLDTRMQYSHDMVNIFDVTNDAASLLSGENADNLNPGGYVWYVRYKDTTLVQESDWVTYNIQPGEKIDVEGVSLSADDISLTPDNLTSPLTAQVLPEHSYVNNILWISSDESVATVDQSGFVTAIGNGTAQITCIVNKDMGTEAAAECTVHVNDFDKVSYVNIVEDSVKISITDESLSRALTYSIYPERDNLNKFSQSWYSDNENVCTVNEGVVKAVGVGTATVTYVVEQDTQQYTDTVKVTVVPEASVVAVKEWGRNDEGDLTFNFEGFSIDDSVIVTVRKSNGDYCTVNNCYYYINGNSLIISKNYLLLLPVGDTEFIFTMENKNSDNNGLITNASTNKAAKIKLLGASSKNVDYKQVNDTNNSSSVSVKVTLASKGTMEYEIVNNLTDRTAVESTLHPNQATFYILTDVRTDNGSPEVTVSYDENYFNVNAIEYDNRSGAEFSYWKYRGFVVTAKGLNGTKVITLGYQSVSYYQNVVCKSFLESLTAKTSSTTLDYTCKKTINLKDYFNCEAPVNELENLESDELWSVDGGTKSSGSDLYVTDYCTVNTKTGEVIALKDTETGKPLKMNMKVSQILSSGTKIEKSASFDLNIIMYKLLKRDHLGQWEPLGRVGMNYQIGGIEEDYIPTSTRIQVIVTDPDGSTERNEFIARMLSNYPPEFTINESGNLNIKLPYKFMRTLRTGTYAVTFNFYDSTGAILESTINTSVEVLPAGTPLTGDDFNPIVWISIMTTVVPIAYLCLRKLKKED